jgi:hypothetical protein
MFWSASENNIDLYADSVSAFIKECIGDVVTNETIKTFPNQKPWMDGGIRTKLKARSTPFNNERGLGICLNINSVAIPSARQSKKPVQGQGGVAIQRLRHETFVAGSTGNPGLQK